MFIKAYKVVSSHPSIIPAYRSAIMCGKQEVAYQIGKTSMRPRNMGPLAVFDNLRDAQIFLAQKIPASIDYAILECEVQTALDDGLYYYHNYRISIKSFVEADLLPAGTVLCNWVRPLRLVNYYKAYT